MLHAFLKPGSGFAFVTTENGKDTAAAFCAYGAGTCYYLLGGVDKERASGGAGALAVDACIAHAAETGQKVFDFEGSMLPEVERYFRTFGGTPTPYFTVNPGALPHRGGVEEEASPPVLTDARDPEPRCGPHDGVGTLEGSDPAEILRAQYAGTGAWNDQLEGVWPALGAPVHQPIAAH